MGELEGAQPWRTVTERPSRLRTSLAPSKESEGRRERDSNPRNRFRFSGFQDHRHRPLGHLSCTNYSDFGVVAGPSRAITSPAMLASTVRVQMLDAGLPFASFRANTTYVRSISKGN